MFLSNIKKISNYIQLEIFYVITLPDDREAFHFKSVVG